MQKDQAYRLIGALKEQWLPDNGYINNGVDDYPRVEVYLSSGGQQIDKGDNSKPVDVVFDVITNNRNEGEAMRIAEELQDTLKTIPVVVPDFNVDMVTMTGITPLTEENGQDERTINRQLVNYTYNLTQINF